MHGVSDMEEPKLSKWSKNVPYKVKLDTDKLTLSENHTARVVLFVELDNYDVS